MQKNTKSSPFLQKHITEKVFLIQWFVAIPVFFFYMMGSVFLCTTKYSFIKIYQPLLKPLLANDTEDNLQKSAYKLNQIITEHGLIYLHRKQN
jgi:hypothetical protein